MMGRGVALFAALALLVAATSAADGAGDDDDDETRFPLIFAAGEGDGARVQRLLDDGVDVMRKSKDGETALHVAAIRGDLTTVRALLEAGAEVDARTPKGAMFHMTPSMWAIYHGHDEFVRLLLEAGADPEAEDENAKSLLQMCDEANQPRIRKIVEGAIEKKKADAFQEEGANAPSSEAVAVFVTVEVPEEKTEEFLKAMKIDVEGSRKEPGCIRFDLIKGEGRKWHFYEVYKDADAMAHHKTLDHYKAWADFRSAHHDTVGASQSVIKGVGAGAQFPF